MIAGVATAVAAFLVVVTVLALFRIASGRSAADRMLGLQLLGTSLTALALLLSVGFATPRLTDVALVFAVLASPTTAVFVASAVRRSKKSRSDDS